MTSIPIWYATAGPGSANSQDGAVIEAECFAKGTYRSLLKLQTFIAEYASLSIPGKEIGIWMVSLNFELVKWLRYLS